MKQITTKEAAALIGRNEYTARRLAEAGRIGAVDRVGAKQERLDYRYSAYKIAEYLMVPADVVLGELEQLRANA